MLNGSLKLGENSMRMMVTNPVFNRTFRAMDNLFEDMRLAVLPEDGQIIEKSRIITERYRAERQEDGDIILRLIVEDEDKNDS